MNILCIAPHFMLAFDNNHPDAIFIAVSQELVQARQRQLYRFLRQFPRLKIITFTYPGSISRDSRSATASKQLL